MSRPDHFASDGDHHHDGRDRPAAKSRGTGMDDYLLLLLSDSNLPTGGFVASSGLESATTHGLLHPPTSSPPLLAFLRLSVSSYARLALPFLREAWALASAVREGFVEGTVESVAKVDDLYDAMLLNHVARRASQAQGVALLTLYTKSFARREGGPGLELVNGLKARARREDATMHLPVCFGVLTGALGLPYGAPLPLAPGLDGAEERLTTRWAERAVHLHLFLHARSILSSAVRLNSIGPYTSQLLLFHDVGRLVDDVVADVGEVRLGRADRESCGLEAIKEGGDEDEDGPATAWPLGEILGARHDVLHVRLFNS